MIAVAYLALGALAAALLTLLSSARDTTDLRSHFCSVADAVAFAEAQDAAGFDCFMSQQQDGWEVRCYRRKEGES